MIPNQTTGSMTENTAAQATNISQTGGKVLTKKDCAVVVFKKDSATTSISENIGNLLYEEGSGNTVCSLVSDSNGGFHLNRYKVDDIINLAKVLQAEKVKKSLDVDVESEVDHASLARELLLPQQPDGSVQVLEGNEKVTLDIFSGNNPKSILDAIHHIEVNQLQDTAPWSIVWNLWKCLQEVGRVDPS
jgi:hypothetical protein